MANQARESRVHETLEALRPEGPVVTEAAQAAAAECRIRMTGRGTKPLEERLHTRMLVDKSFHLTGLGSGTTTESEKDHLYVAQISVEVAAEAIRLAFMRQNTAATPRAAEVYADREIMKLYHEAAAQTSNEVNRLEFTSHKAERLANNICGGQA
ncbi:hypothetical protein [Glutamicibacter sp. NPDC087344]|uniref:hypothetical protein n=1 Tax=Glutamicibacter sp. NPDC087344 TaxID=3363994 RepID=UPI0038037B22